MAGVGPFRYCGAEGRPRRFSARFLLYVAFSLLAWFRPPLGALIVMGGVGILGAGLRWGAWLRRLGWMWLFVLAPLWATLLAWHPGTHPDALHGAGARSLVFLALLAASHWLTSTSTVFEIRAFFERLLGGFGPKVSGPGSLALALTLGFIPWVSEQLSAVREAGLLRGVPPRNLWQVLRALTLPLFVRVVEKARRTTDALELRGE